ncbi:TonB-dependent receptor [Thalassolituus sp. LLYu03]|uniref:TonB-dependent receptor n=1 Tax=Thalassolituus sp. LLYu03 TaxID=3421656 RepID=UPI003D2CC1E0
MNHQNTARTLLSLAICSALAAVHTAHADEQANLPTLDKVTVVGEKTERSLKDTTSSVSVIDGADLANNQYLSVNSAVSDTVNLVVLPGTNPDIRGVSGNGSATGFLSFSGGSKARVSRLVDGVAEPFIADLTGDTGLWDVEQIEVYRGPQSTTNGRNSIGGSIYIKTNKPGYEWEGKARLSARNQDSLINTAAMINAPLVADQLALRIAAENTTGDTYNKGLEYDTNPSTHDLNELKSQRLRSKLLWEPAAIEGLSALLTYVTSEEKGDTGREYFTADDPYAFIPVTQRYMDTESDTLSLDLGYDVSDAVSVDVLVAKTDFDWGFDEYLATAASQSQVSMKEEDTDIDAKVNFHPQDAVLTGFVGLAYSDRSQDFGSTGRTVYEGDDSATSSALYGEATYQFNPQWSLTLGGRIQKEEQTRNFSFRGADTAQLDREKTIHLPKLAVQFAANDNTTLFASARKGYNQGGGGFNTTANEYYYFDEEYVTAYEVGSRSTLLDGDLNLSVNLFHNTYDGFQSLNSSRVIENMNEAVTYGAEVEARLFVSTELQLRAGLGLLESEITDAADEYPEADGNRLNSAPGVTASLGGRYWLTHALNVDLSANYVGEYFGDFLNTEERKAGDFITARLSATYEQGDWLLSAFVNNLTNEEALLSKEPASTSYPNGTASIVDPRTIGASVTYSF